MKNQRKTVSRRKGTTMVLAAVSMCSVAGFLSLAVDWGRVQVAKCQLQSSADAAARYAVAGMQNNIGGVSSAGDNAAAVVAQNRVENRSITFDKNADVEIGYWNASTHKFQTVSYLSQANAVRVTLKCVQSRNSAIPLMFLSMLGRNSMDVSASSIASIDYSGATGGAGNGTYEYYIPATSNPWLAGMPSGTIANPDNPANNSDYAGTAFTDDGSSKSDGVNTGTSGSGSGAGSGTNLDNWSNWGDYSAKKASPIKAGGISVSPGSTMTFDGVNGGANNFNSGTYYDGDGNPGWTISNYVGAENGISNIYAPINSVIGVFLSDSRPSRSAAPSTLDFSSTTAQNYVTLSPALKQTFFIGNGRTSSGEIQKITVPAGATRLYIGTMDGWEWNNNIGGFNVTAHVYGKVYNLKERP